MNSLEQLVCEFVNHGSYLAYHRGRYCATCSSTVGDLHRFLASKVGIILQENNSLCKHYSDFEGVCTNGDCPLRADFVDSDATCKVCKWFESEDADGIN